MGIIVKWTNVKISECRKRYSDQTRHEFINADEIEIKASLGLSQHSAVFKSNREDVDSLFATDCTEHEIFPQHYIKNQIFIFTNLLAI